MSTRNIYGTDCFEVEAFIDRNEVSKLFKVRHKSNGQFYAMEVAHRRKGSSRKIKTSLQETQYQLSKFWLNLKFTFQTSSKLYYILEYIGETTLESLVVKHGQFSEDLIRFYASEILIAIEEIHSHGLFYGELALDKVCIDNTGHVVLWRNFCGKKYWTRYECICSMDGLDGVSLCENPHEKSSELEVQIDYQLLGIAILQLFSEEHLTSALNNKTTPQEGLARLMSSNFTLPSSSSVFARDLVTRLVKGQFYNSNHIKSHPFFLGVNWKMVQARLTTPPALSRKTPHRPTLRKTSSESLAPQRPVRYDDPISSPYVRPSTPLIASPANVCSPTISYPHHHQHSILPSRTLNSYLSSPDLTGFGGEVDHVTCRCDQPVDALFQPIRHYSDYQSPPERSTPLHGLHSQSLCDLSHIQGHAGHNMAYARPRTSSDCSEAIVNFTDNRNKGISQHKSFPPGDIPFQLQHNEYLGCSNYGNHNERYMLNQCYRSCSDLAHAHTKNANHFSHGSDSRSYLTRNTYGLPDNTHHVGDSGYGRSMGHVIGDGLHSREPMATLPRSQSCSDLVSLKDDEQRRTLDPRATPTFENMERRKLYPLAQLPIPSFAEFKRKNSKSMTEDRKNEGVISKDTFSTKDVQRSTMEFVNKKHTTENRTNEKVKSNETLTTQRIAPNKGERDFRAKVREKLTSTNLLTSRNTPIPQEDKDIKSTSNESKHAVDKSNGYYSHNDVIHNLMLKYGLYERSEKRKNRNDKEKTAGNDDNPPKMGSCVDSPRKTEFKETTERIENKDVHESPVSTPRIGRAGRSPRSERRRASAVGQQLNQAPTLTRKSQSTLGPDSLSTSNEDANNNVETRTVKEELSSYSSPNLGLKEARHKELSASKTDLLSITNVYKTSKLVRPSPSPEPPDPNSVAMDKEKNPSLQKTSKTIWAAAKFKLKLRSPLSSPLLKRKASPKPKAESPKDDAAVERHEKSDENAMKMRSESERSDSSLSISAERGISASVKDLYNNDNPRARKFSMELPNPGALHKGGLHTSLLSISSSVYSTDNEFDDSSSLHSEYNDTERSTCTRRRWESFHSSISADSGSAHMYEFENDSVEDPFGEGEKESEDRQKSDAEIERTDSGIGGDIGGSKQSWEDIVLKSSKRWSIVAATAHHWQDLAKKTKETKDVTSKKKSAAQTITEDMVECLDCQKYFLPDTVKHDRIIESPPGRNTATICPKCRERRVERKEAIIELVQTEINYANDLQILKEEFYSPLQSGGILQPDNLAEIFLNLQELVEVSTKFSSRLEQALEVSVSKGNEEFSQVNVGSIFLESVDFFQSYEIYCTKQNAASALLESLQKKNELLKIFLNVTCRENPKCRKMDLNSFLLAPVQRIMKYPLLLSRIRKATPRRNPDREKLMQAQRKIEDQLNRINALNSTVESRQRRYRGSGHLGRSDSLDKLQMKKMASEILNWAMGEMHLLMHGVFEVVIHEFTSSGGWNRRANKRAVDVFMLFCVRGLSEAKTVDSDDDNSLEEPLFPSEADATDVSLVLLRKKLNGKYTLFKEPISLQSCVICKDSETNDCFEIINMSRETYIFKATSTKESRKWLKHLRLQAKDLGSWKKRRNGLPNIMIKTI